MEAVAQGQALHVIPSLVSITTPCTERSAEVNWVHAQDHTDEEQKSRTWLWVYFTTVSWLFFPIAISKYFQVFLVKEEAHLFPWPQRRESRPGGSPAGTVKGLARLCDCHGSQKTELTFLQDYAHPVPGDETLLWKVDNHLSGDL